MRGCCAKVITLEQGAGRAVAGGKVAPTRASVPSSPSSSLPKRKHTPSYSSESVATMEVAPNLSVEVFPVVTLKWSERRGWERGLFPLSVALTADVNVAMERG